MNLDWLWSIAGFSGAGLSAFLLKILGTRAIWVFKLIKYGPGAIYSLALTIMYMDKVMQDDELDTAERCELAKKAATAAEQWAMIVNAVRHIVEK